MNQPRTHEETERLMKRLADDGKIIEAGWISLRLYGIPPPGAPDIQVEEMRRAFFAGAHHLFASIMTVLEPGTEPTANDLERMDKIHRELDAYRAQLAAQVGH